MNHEPDRYHAYLLRLWQVKEQGHLIWRTSLEDAHTHERVGFSSLDELVDYLQQMIKSPDAPNVSAGSEE
ncbi:MAG: hypothetical protein AAF702_24215 [Chloroflexota bacterium]